MSIQISIGDTLYAQILPVDDKGGRDAVTTGVATWSVSDPTILSATPALTPPDGTVAVLKALKPGTVTVTASVDGFSDSGEVTVAPRKLAGISLSILPPANP